MPACPPCLPRTRSDCGLGDDVENLHEVTIRQVVPAHRLVRLLPHLARPLAEQQQVTHGLGPPGSVVSRHQHAGDPVLDLVLDAADRATYHGSLLPHRLSHRQPEGLHARALRDHRAHPLQGVDDRRVDLTVRGRDDEHVDPAGHGLRQGRDPFRDLLQGPRGTGLARRIGRGPSQDQVRVARQGLDLGGEGLDELQTALERVPALDLGHHLGALGYGRAGGGPARGVLAQAPEGVRPTVLADEGNGVEGRLPVKEPGQAHYRGGLVHVEHAVLGGVGVDRGGDDGAALLLGVGRQVLRARGDDEVGVLEVAVEEGPGPLPLLAGVGRAHVAPPDDGRPGLVEGTGEPGGGWVVEDDDVPLAHVLHHVLGVGGQDVLVEVPLLVGELAPVAVRAVEGGVEPRGDGQELGGGVKREPPGVNAQPARVADQRGHGLGRSCLRGGRRRHGPHGAAVQQSVGCGDAVVQTADRDLVEVALQVRQGQGCDVDSSHVPILPLFCVTRSTLSERVARSCPDC